MKKHKRQFPPTVLCRFEFTQNDNWATGDFFINGERIIGHSVAKNGGSYPGSFKKFQVECIRQVQDEMILDDYVANYGLIAVPENFVSEFWTPEFILRLADRLRRPRKRPSNINQSILKIFLQAMWTAPKYMLCDLSEKKLARFINDTFNANPKITPAAARKIAQRLELFSTLETQG